MPAVTSLRIKKYLERRGRVTLRQLENYCSKGKGGVHSDFRSVLERMENDGAVSSEKTDGHKFYSLA